MFTKVTTQKSPRQQQQKVAGIVAALILMPVLTYCFAASDSKSISNLSQDSNHHRNLRSYGYDTSASKSAVPDISLPMEDPDIAPPMEAAPEQPIEPAPEQPIEIPPEPTLPIETDPPKPEHPIETDPPKPEHPIETKPPEPIHPIEGCAPPSPNDDCHTNASYKQCLDFENNGCIDILSSLSCPPIYECQKYQTKPPETAPPTPQPTDPPIHPIEGCIVPDKNDDCHTDKSYKSCSKLEDEGCIEIFSSMSCPPVYECGKYAPPTNPPTPKPTTEKPTKSPTKRPTDPPIPVHPIERQCVPPTANDICQTEESYQACLVLEAQQCQKIIATASCPPSYECADPKHPIYPLPDPCVEPTANNECHSEQSYQQCKMLQEDGCKMLQATLSCPPLYSCASFNTASTQCVTPDDQTKVS